MTDFGYTSVPTIPDTIDAGYVQGVIATAPINGTLASMSYWTHTAGDHFKGLLINPSTLAIIAITNAGTRVADNWVTVAFASPPTVVSGTDYLLAVIVDAFQTLFYATPAGVNARKAFADNNYASPTSPITGSFLYNDDNVPGVYATYAGGGGGGQPTASRFAFLDSMRGLFMTRKHGVGGPHGASGLYRSAADRDLREAIEFDHALRRAA